jgi:DNA-binding transcriptional regulator GbsR (MarR family)
LGSLSELVIAALLKQPMTATALAKKFKTSNARMWDSLRRLHVDKQAVVVVDFVHEAGCKKPVRLYLATAKGLAILNKKGEKNANPKN